MCMNSTQNPLIVVAALVGVVQQLVIVKLYECSMNDRHTGSLYLKEPITQCSWYSVETGLRTDWHGEWQTFNGCGFIAHFDCKGRSDQRKHIVVYGNMQGSGDAGRKVELTV